MIRHSNTITLKTHAESSILVICFLHAWRFRKLAIGSDVSCAKFDPQYNWPEKLMHIYSWICGSFIAKFPNYYWAAIHSLFLYTSSLSSFYIINRRYVVLKTIKTRNLDALKDCEHLKSYPCNSFLDLRKQGRYLRVLVDLICCVC